MISERDDHKFLIRADCYGIITTNEKISFWFPRDRGTLFFDDTYIYFKGKNTIKETFKINFNRIIKLKILSLNPTKNKWISSPIGSPFYLLFWNPLWNRYLLNITFLDNKGQPKELFLKLKTKKVTETTLSLLKKSMTFHKKIL